MGEIPKTRAIEGRLARIVNAIEGGLYQTAMKDRMPAPESRAAGIAAEMDALCAPSRIVELRPKATNRYAATVAKPRDMLSDANPSARDSRELIRSVIERIVLNPGKRRGRYEVEIHGQSAVMLGADQSKQAGTKSTLTVVAGARNHRELTLKVAV